MSLKNTTPAQLGALALRLAVGVNLLMHGFVRFGENFAGFEQWMLKIFASSPLSPSMISLAAQVLPPAEFVLGFLIILGFQTQWVLFLAGLLMTSLIFGMCLLQNWEIVGIQMIYVVCYFLLLNSPHLRFFSVDSLLTKKKGAVL